MNLKGAGRHRLLIGGAPVHSHAAASVAIPSSRTPTVVTPPPAASVVMPTG
jgi:hypothetical protein